MARHLNPSSVSLVSFPPCLVRFFLPPTRSDENPRSRPHDMVLLHPSWRRNFSALPPHPLPFPIVAVLGCCPASRNARFMSAAGPHARVSNLSPALPAAQGKQPAAWRRPRSSPQKLHPHRLSQSYSTYSYVETRMLLPVSRARHHRKSCCSGGCAGNVRRQRAGTRRAAGPAATLMAAAGWSRMWVSSVYGCCAFLPACLSARRIDTVQHRRKQKNIEHRHPMPVCLHPRSIPCLPEFASTYTSRLLLKGLSSQRPSLTVTIFLIRRARLHLQLLRPDANRA